MNSLVRSCMSCQKKVAMRESIYCKGCARKINLKAAKQEDVEFKRIKKITHSNKETSFSLGLSPREFKIYLRGKAVGYKRGFAAAMRNSHRQDRI